MFSTLHGPYFAGESFHRVHIKQTRTSIRMSACSHTQVDHLGTATFLVAPAAGMFRHGSGSHVTILGGTF